MKLHLPIRLFRAVIALMTASPAILYAAYTAPTTITVPTGYAEVQVDEAADFTSGTDTAVGVAFRLTGDLSINSPSSSIISGGNCSWYFTSDSADSLASLITSNTYRLVPYHVGYDEDVNFAALKNLSFTNNHAGVIYSGIVSLYNNVSISFNENTATSSGGAINGGIVALNNNQSVGFIDNCAESYDIYSTSSGGAIYSSVSVTLKNNERVFFQKNNAIGGSVSGGAIYGESIILSDNGNVEFCENTTGLSGYHMESCVVSRGGGAIRANGNLTIANNDDVLFQGNAEITEGTYRLRSIYAGGSGDVIILSAAEHKKIEFRDSMCIAFGSAVKLNADYTDSNGVTRKQAGDIIFTGAYTEDSLNSLLVNTWRTATSNEIQTSRTSVINAMTNLYGGRLRVEDGAIYRGYGITAMAESASIVRVKDAELNHSGYDLTFNAGTQLELIGDNTLTAATLNMMEDSTLIFNAADSLGCTRLNGNLLLAGNVIINLSNDANQNKENGILMSVSGAVAGWDNITLTVTGAGTYDSEDVIWVGNNLILNYNEDTYNPYFNGNLTITTHQSGAFSYDNYSSISFENIVSSPNGGAINGVTVTLNNNNTVTFSNNTVSESSDFYYTYGGAIYGDRVILKSNSTVTFSKNKINSSNNGACGGAIYGNSITLCDNGTVSFRENTISVPYHAFGGAICSSTVTLNNNDIVTFSDNTVSGCFSRGGAFYGYNISLSDNGNVTFRGNTVSATDSFDYSSYGGAIYSTGNLKIQNNDSVLFEKNAEITDGTYRLRSIYVDESGNNISLSATKDGSIEFRDSIYIASGHTVELNADYKDAAGVVHKQTGDIIFTGATTENDLYTVKGNVAGTAKEIQTSRTSEIHGKVTLYGGSLQVQDNAVLKTTAGITAADGSNSVIKISNATLDAGSSNINIRESAGLELSNGATVNAATINIDEGASFVVSNNEQPPAMLAFTLDEAALAQSDVYNQFEGAVVNANLSFSAGSTLAADGACLSMAEGKTLTFEAITGGEKINLVLTLGTEYSEDGQVLLFSDADVVKFILDGQELSSTESLLANTFFSGAWVNETTTLNYSDGVVYVQGGNTVAIPEPATATLTLLALTALAARRRRTR